MKLLYTIYTEINKTVFSIGFLACTIVTAVLCFTSQCYIDNTSNINNNVFETLLYIDWQTLVDNDIANIDVIRSGLTGYCTMFMPIISALPFVTAFCNERNTGSIRLNIVRIGKLKYCIAKFISALVSAGLAVTFGCVIFAAIVYPTFPNVEDCVNSYYVISNDLPNIPIELFYFLSGAFLYGAVSVLPAFFMSSFVKNHYIITCLPFMLTYIQKVVLNKLTSAGYTEKIVEGKLSIMEKCMIFYPDTICTWYNKAVWTKYNFLYNGICAAAAIIGFVIIMDLRFDKGE